MSSSRSTRAKRVLAALGVFMILGTAFVPEVAHAGGKGGSTTTHTGGQGKKWR